jgi:hypothetical protein
LQSEVVPFLGMDAEARFDVVKAVMTADLSEQERDELVLAGVIFGVMFALILLFELSNVYLGKYLSNSTRIVVTCSYGLNSL